MIRRTIVTLLSVSLLLAGLAVAQNPPGGDEDPPVRLKKKNRPNVAEKPQEELKPEEQPKEPPKDPPKEKDPKMGDEPPPADDSDMDEAEVLNRVGKNMRSSEDRLDRAELNDSTRQVQDDILKDLDALINQEKNGGGGGGDDQKQQDQNDQQNPENKQKQDGQNGQDSKTKIGMAGRKKGLKGSQQAQRGQGRKKPGGQDNGQAQANAGQPGGTKPQGEKPGGPQQANAGQQPGNPMPGGTQTGSQPGGGGQTGGPESSKLAEIYKDEWGHLPETLRAPMDAHSREKFMAKYNDLTKQYFIKVAEQSRKKD